jgi:hypothetical protein
MKTKYVLSLIVAMSLLLFTGSGAYAWTLDCGASSTKDVGVGSGGHANSNLDTDRCGLVILRFKFMPEGPAETEFMKPDFHKVVDKSTTDKGRELAIEKSKAKKQSE